MRVRIEGTVRAWRGSTVYPGVETKTREYYRRAAHVCRKRMEIRLGREEYLRRERERQRKLYAKRKAERCNTTTTTSHEKSPECGANHSSP